MKKMRRMLSTLVVAAMLLNVPVTVWADDAAEAPAAPAEQVQVVEEAPKAAEPAAEAPKAEEPAAEAPKAEAPAVEEAPKAEEPAVEAPAVEEAPKAEEPAQEAPAAEEPAVEEPVVEEPAVEAPAAEEPVIEEAAAEEPVTEAPVAEEPAVEEPAVAEPVAEEAVEEPAAEEAVEEEAAEEEAAEEEAAEAFTGKLSIIVMNGDMLRLGGEAYLQAVVNDANMGYRVTWQIKEIKDGLESWKDISNGEILTLPITQTTIANEYRCVVTADDGAKLTAGYRLPASLLPAAPVEKAEPAQKADDTNVETPAEEPAAEEPAAPAPEFSFAPAAEQPAEEEIVEEPVAEEPVSEEPAEEIPVEEVATEEPVVEEPAAEEPVEEIAAEEPAAEEIVAEEPAAEEPAEEIVAEEPAVEEPAVEIEDLKPVEKAAEEVPAEEPAAEVVILSDSEGPSVEEPIEAAAEEAAEEAPVFTFAPAPEAEADEEIEIEDYDTALGLNGMQTITLTANEGEDYQDVNVREGADGLAAIFTSLPEGAEVTVVDFDGEWATVVVDGQLGYIYKDDIADKLDLTEEEPAEAEAPKAEPKVTIFTSRRSVMQEGEPVYLTSKLEGFEGYTEFKYIWYVDKGNGYEVVSGANEPTYTFAASAETLTWGWQLEVLCR